MITCRKAEPKDVEILSDLYINHLALYPSDGVLDFEKYRRLLTDFCEDDNYNILVGEIEGTIVSSVTLIVIPNLTHNMRPYAIIENVVTHCEHRGKGYATELMNRASMIAKERGCYKIMLMTGSKKESTLKFYENCGFNKNDKTAFIKWL